MTLFRLLRRLDRRFRQVAFGLFNRAEKAAIEADIDNARQTNLKHLLSTCDEIYSRHSTPEARKQREAEQEAYYAERKAVVDHFTRLRG